MKHAVLLHLKMDNIQLEDTQGGSLLRKRNSCVAVTVVRLP